MCRTLGLGVKGGNRMRCPIREKTTVLETHHSLQVTNEETVEYLSCFITVSNILEGFGCVLTAYVQENLLSTTARKLLVMAYKR